MKEMTLSGTLSRFGEKNGLEVTILSGDRDNFQLATDKVTIEIPRTKAGKTETDYYDRNKVIEEYGVEPWQLIQVKGLMGDTSDNIPGVPGVGEKTALTLIKEYMDIDKLYEKLEQGTDTIKGKLREKLVENKDLAFLSRELGRINIDSPIEENLEEMKLSEWDKKKVLELFKKYRFNRYIERFSLQGEGRNEETIKTDFTKKEIQTESELQEFIKLLEKQEKLIYSFVVKDNSEQTGYIIPKELISISIYLENTVYYYSFETKQQEFVKNFKELFENKALVGYELARDYILLKQIGITPKNIVFDVKIAAYLLNPVASKYPLEALSATYLGIDILEILQQNGVKEEKQQLNLFEMNEPPKEDKQKQEGMLYAYAISKLEPVLTEKLQKENALSLFSEIEMPLVGVLADMQFVGMRVEKEELISYGNQLKEQLETLTKEIHTLAGEEFNINSPKQLGEVLFEKLKLPYAKKTKSGYSTDVDALEKIKEEHPVVEKILEYRAMAKLNSTYVEGLLPYINKEDKNSFLLPPNRNRNRKN